MSSYTRISYWAVAVIFLLVVGLKLCPFVIATLFGYLALRRMAIRGNKWVSVTLYVATAIALCVGAIWLSNAAYHLLPRVVDKAVPAMAAFAEKNGLQLPFTDFATLKVAVLQEASDGVAILGAYAKLASIQFIFVLAGLVTALSIYLHPQWTAVPDAPGANTGVYDGLTREIGRRFGTLYRSFARVMEAQIVISAINTTLTAVFLLLNHYPYMVLLVPGVFLCGLIPIVGNILSNVVVVGVGFTVSPRSGLLALLFLVAIHKLEYFLNSKIVGRHIDSPIWMTLVALIVGERLMGISGLILAPVLLHYVRSELFCWSTAKATYPESSAGKGSPSQAAT